MSTKEDAARALHQKLEGCMLAFRGFTSAFSPTTEDEAKRFHKDTEPFLCHYKDDEIFLPQEIVDQCEEVSGKLIDVWAGMSPLPTDPSMNEEEKDDFYTRRREYHKRITSGDISDPVKELKELLRQHVEAPAIATGEEPTATNSVTPSWANRAGKWVLDHIVASIIATIISGVVLTALLGGC